MHYFNPRSMPGFGPAPLFFQDLCQAWVLHSLIPRSMPGFSLVEVFRRSNSRIFVNPAFPNQGLHGRKAFLTRNLRPEDPCQDVVLQLLSRCFVGQAVRNPVPVQAGPKPVQGKPGWEQSPNFKLLRSPRIDSIEPITPGCVAWRAGMTTIFLLCS